MKLFDKNMIELLLKDLVIYFNHIGHGKALCYFNYYINIIFALFNQYSQLRLDDFHKLC